MALERGLLSYSIFLPDKDAGHSAKSGGGDGTTMFIRENDCIIRIRIERATDLNAYDPDLGKGLRERIKQKQKQ